jgi:uncharacterized phage protein gp47/JayE
MPIERISANQFVELLRTGIKSRNRDYDVTTGAIPDLSINPQARVFELQHDDVRKVSLLLTLQNAQEFDPPYDLDLEGIVFNEGLTRNQGAAATGVLVFSRSSAPTADVPVQRGYPVATVADEGTGLTITFVATETKTLLAASASSYFNIETQRYELSVPVIAVVSGAQGRVAANRINRTLRPLVGFDSVTNPAASQGGRDAETNQQLIDRYFIAIIGRELATPTGIQKVTADDFPDISDALVVYGSNPLLTRAGDDAGAVDVYVIGDDALEQTESPQYLGAGQLIQISTPPVIEVLSVRDLATGTTFVEGTDYDVVFDSSGYGDSVRAADGIRFRFTGAEPAIGAPVTITYVYNNLIRRLQTALTLDDTLVFGRDLLFKMGTEVPIVVSANFRVLAGFSPVLVKAAMEKAILKQVNETLRLGGDVEEFDIDGVVAQISGVDNFIPTRLTKASVPSGVADIPIADNEYPSLAAADLTLTPLL